LSLASICARSSFGFPLVAPSLLALLVSSVLKNVLGGSIGIHRSVENLGITLAPLLFARIWSLCGPQYAFIVCAVSKRALTLGKAHT